MQGQDSYLHWPDIINKLTRLTSRAALSRVPNGKAGISLDLAVRLGMAGVSPARFRINLQANYDLWKAQLLDA